MDALSLKIQELEQAAESLKKAARQYVRDYECHVLDEHKVIDVGDEDHVREICANCGKVLEPVFTASSYPVKGGLQ